MYTVNCLEILPQSCVFNHASWKRNCFVPLLTAIHKKLCKLPITASTFCMFPSQFKEIKWIFEIIIIWINGKICGWNWCKDRGRKMHQDTYNKNTYSLKFVAYMPFDGEGCSSWDEWYSVNLKSVMLGVQCNAKVSNLHYWVLYISFDTSCSKAMESLVPQMSKHSQSKLQMTIARLSSEIKIKSWGAQQSNQIIQPKSLFPVKSVSVKEKVFHHLLQQLPKSSIKRDQCGEFKGQYLQLSYFSTFHYEGQILFSDSWIYEGNFWRNYGRISSEHSKITHKYMTFRRYKFTLNIWDEDLFSEK